MIIISVQYVEDAPLDPQHKKLNKCRHIVAEIKSTERNFVGQLSQLLELDRKHEPFLVMCVRTCSRRRRGCSTNDRLINQARCPPLPQTVEYV